MDLEMTGLDPATDLIVEIATLVTDGDLNIVAEGPDLVIHVDDAALEGMSEVVKNMHAKSGLTDAIRASTVMLEEAGQATLAFAPVLGLWTALIAHEAWQRSTVAASNVGTSPATRIEAAPAADAPGKP